MRRTRIDRLHQCKEFDVFSVSTCYSTPSHPQTCPTINVQHLEHPLFLQPSRTRTPPTHPQSTLLPPSFVPPPSSFCTSYTHRHSRIVRTASRRDNPTGSISPPGPSRPSSIRSAVRIIYCPESQRRTVNALPRWDFFHVICPQKVDKVESYKFLRRATIMGMSTADFAH
jgi:hypothetical protein